jgi:hypothetical protein
VDVGVELGGLPELEARLNHARTGVMDLTRQLGAQLADSTPPMVAFESVQMRARPWGAGDVWTLPAGSWVAGRDGSVQLLDPADQLQAYVQDLLNGK